jgi:hypothetical protein
MLTGEKCLGYRDGLVINLLARTRLSDGHLKALFYGRFGLLRSSSGWRPRPDFPITYSTTTINFLLCLGLLATNSDLPKLHEANPHCSSKTPELIVWTTRRGWGIMCWYNPYFAFELNPETEYLH